jgi:hypothetical protein
MLFKAIHPGFDSAPGKLVVLSAVCACADGDDIGELFDSIDNPLAPMLIALAGMCIYTAEKGAAYTARNDSRVFLREVPGLS